MDRVAQFAPKVVEPAPGAHLRIVKSEQALVSSETTHRPHNDTGERAWAEAALAGVAADLAACGEGGRNHALNASAYRMGRMVARGWIEGSRVEHALTDACRANGLFASDGPSGVRATLASGLRSGMANPHEDLKDNRADDDAELAEGNRIAGVLIANDDGTPKTIVVDGVTIDAETGEIVDEPPRQDEARRTENEASRPPAGSKPIELETINAASLARKQVPRQHWLVEDLIPEGNVTMLSGDGATGKSLLAFQCRDRLSLTRTEIMTTRKLTPKQALFVSEILVDGNASAAAKRAGYSAKTADEQGHRLSRNAQVAAEIAKRQSKRLERNEVTAERVIAQLAAIAFADPRKLFDANGALKPIDQIDDDTRAALVIEVTQGTDADGNPTFSRKVKFAEKLRALEMLGKYLGLFRDRLEIAGSAENPIQILIQRINSHGSSIRPVVEGAVEEYDRAA
jgi:phage terminase small subunit